MVSVIDAKRAFSRRSALLWLLLLNVALFVALRLVAAAEAIAGVEGWLDTAITAVSLPTSPMRLIASPWTLLSYMFAQFDVNHLLFNMLWLAWFGLFMQNDFGNRRTVAAYFTGGFAGAVTYVLWSILSPEASVASTGLIGSSAAVISVALAVAVAEPSRPIEVLFFGNVKLKWVAVVMTAIALIWFSGYNHGSDMAHAGGALTGVALGLYLRRNVGSASECVQFNMDEDEKNDPADDVQLDNLLDKIRCSGYDSLSVEERAKLFELSQRIKKG